MYYDKIATLYNKEMIDGLVKDVWFKRNWLMLHDMIGLSMEKMIEVNETNNSDEIFYFFIEQVFKNITD